MPMIRGFNVERSIDLSLKNKDGVTVIHASFGREGLRTCQFIGVDSHSSEAFAAFIQYLWETAYQTGLDHAKID
jgi:hypothetical protein